MADHEQLRATARDYEALAEKAKRVNTHDRPFYLRQAALHAQLATALTPAGEPLLCAFQGDTYGSIYARDILSLHGRAKFDATLQLVRVLGRGFVYVRTTELGRVLFGS